MRSTTNTDVIEYVTEFASPSHRMLTSYSDKPITFISWLELEAARIASKPGDLNTAIVHNLADGTVALALVLPAHAEDPKSR
jgi:hypothetical protein